MLTINEFSAILNNRVLIIDGAVGSLVKCLDSGEDIFADTRLVTKSGDTCTICDLLNVYNPGIVTNFHKSYITAGAEIISTNTFNSNSVSLNDAGVLLSPGFIYDLNRMGAESALNSTKQSSGTVYVAGSVGPTSREALEIFTYSKQVRSVTPIALRQAFIEQIEGLIDGGVDILLLETFYNLINLKAALHAANDVMCQKHKTIPIVVSLALADKSNRIPSGQTLSEVVAAIREFDNIVCIGLNCCSYNIGLLPALRELKHSSQYPVCLYPAVGIPDASGIYGESPDTFSANLIEVIKEEPVSILGGCCGTTPKHIAILKSRLHGV